jgi:hypothetical protein
MWWVPQSDSEARLSEDMNTLRGFRAEAAESGVWGIGSIWSAEYRTLVPVIALESEDSTPLIFDIGTRDGEPLEVRLPFRPPRTNGPLHIMKLARPTPKSVGGEERERVSSWINDFVQIRDPLICRSTNKRGSGAISVEAHIHYNHSYNNHFYSSGHRFYPGLLTAGHTFPGGVGSVVDQERTIALFFSKRKLLGKVSRWVVPEPGKAGYDAAIIELFQRTKRHRQLVTKYRRRFLAPEPIVVYGAVSGLISRAAVMGALVEVDYGEARWLNCWLVAPSGMLRGGDSGSAVFTREDNAFLGLYVGSSGFSSRPLFHYVQDGWSLQRDVLRHWDAEIM